MVVNRFGSHERHFALKAKAQDNLVQVTPGVQYHRDAVVGKLFRSGQKRLGNLEFAVLDGHNDYNRHQLNPAVGPGIIFDDRSAWTLIVDQLEDKALDGSVFSLREERHDSNVQLGCGIQV
jgi:hypothetical protein